MAAAKGIYTSLDELLALQERARYIADSLSALTQNMLQGNRPSKLHGRGGAFDQIRHYLAGDDVRNIDWNVTARMGKPFIRVFNEERERPVLLLVDQSSDMFFATRKQLKSVVAAQVAAYLLWMAYNQKRPCGAVIVGDESFVMRRPRSNQGHLYGILDQLVTYNHKLSNDSLGEDGVTAFTDGLRQLTQIVSKDAIVVLISDFQHLSLPHSNDGCWSLIERLNHKANVIATPIYDGIIDALPEQGHFLASYAGLQAELDFSTHAARQAISQGTQGRIDALSRRFAEYGTPVLPFSTYLDIEQQLLSGLMIGGEKDD